MIRTRMLVSDDTLLMTSVVVSGRARLDVRHGDDALRIESLDPVVWRRLATACANLARDHEAALAPPRREMQP